MFGDDTMGNKWLFFAAGVVVGAGAYALIQSGAAKKAAVTVVGKGMELQEKVAAMAERVHESAEDIVAEAKAAKATKAAPAQA
jgi:hypothetical protein